MVGVVPGEQVEQGVGSLPFLRILMSVKSLAMMEVALQQELVEAAAL